MQALIGLSVILTGIMAYEFKKRDQLGYGLLEVVFAGVSAMVTAAGLHRDHDMFARIATLCGCAYVVARGVGNMAEG